MVPTDAAGVPHGGPYGDVSRHERELNKHGLYVGWSRVQHCFGIATKQGPYDWTFQCHMKLGTKIVPFSEGWTWMILYLWDQHSMKTDANIIETMARLQREEADKKYQAAAADRDDALKDAVRASMRAHGLSGPRVFSIPKVVRPHGRLHLGRN